MSKKDLFILIFKLFGLYLFVGLLISFLPQIYISIFMTSSGYFDWFPILIIIVGTGISYLLINKAASITKFLNLDRGFETDNIELGSIDEKSIIKVSLLIMGLYFLLFAIPDLIVNLVYIFKNSIDKSSSNTLLETFNLNKGDNYSLAISAIQAVIGFLIVFNYKRIAEYFNKY